LGSTRPQRGPVNRAEPLSSGEFDDVLAQLPKDDADLTNV
jgi:hypothetical protein